MEAVEPGCPVCWAKMKEWGSVDVFGTRHTFDMVAKNISVGRDQIRHYSSQFVAALSAHRIPAGLATEQEFKRRVVFPVAREVAAAYPDIRVYTPPWHNERVCGSHPESSLDPQGTLAVEVKFVSMTEGRKPNAEVQRLVGQSMLAASRHRVVIGVCGHRGAMNPNHRRDESPLVGVQWRTPSDVHLLFLEVP